MIAKDAWEQLRIIRDISNKTRTLHESQVLNLKMWPFLAVTQADPVKSEIELNWTGNSIQFNLYKKKGLRSSKNQNERLRILDESVKDLLGNWWSVYVVLDGKVLYEGRAITDGPGSNLQHANSFKRGSDKADSNTKGKSGILPSTEELTIKS